MIRAKIKLQKYKLWKLKEADAASVKEISVKTGLDLVISRILVSRGIDSLEAYKTFVNPNKTQFHDPFLFQDMKIAVDRILSAVEKQEKVLIYGDYDVDGITSTATLILFLRDLGLQVDYHIPDRQEHGYGLSIQTLKNVKHKQYDLIITVDCGISAFEEVNYLNENKIDIIITDHHTCKDKLPKALAIVATSRDDCEYPFKSLAGVGVAFKLIQAISISIKQEDLFLKYIDLAALGTVADVVKLTGENRAIVSEGLRSIKGNCNIGLRALLDSVDLGDKQNGVTGWTFGFVLAPRINAAGRVSDARKAVEMLIASDYQFASDISKQLNVDNNIRKLTEQQITLEAINMVKTDPSFEKDKVLVLSASQWHQGVIGIVASRLVDKFYKPVIIISVSGEDGKGSARSVEGFNMYDALSSCSHILERFGGHAPAAGLSIKLENIELLRQMVNSYASNNINDLVFQPRIHVDAKVSADEITLYNIAEIAKLEPFGCGNPEPIFWITDMEVFEIKFIGADFRHLKMTLKKDGKLFSAVAFGMAERYQDIINSKKIDVACSLQNNVWNGISKIQLRITDIQYQAFKVVKDAYYSSLEAIFPYLIPLEDREEQEDSFDFNMNSFLENVFLNVEGSRISTLLLNDLYSITEVVGFVQKNHIICRIYAANELVWCSELECIENQEFNKTVIIINPLPGALPKMKSDYFILVGTWTNMGYKNSVISYLKEKNYSYHDISNMSVCSKELAPTRQDLRCIYQHIKTACSKDNYSTTIFSLASQVANSYKTELNSFKIKKAIDIFSELCLLSVVESEDEKIDIEIIEFDNCNGDLLETSKTYNYLRSL